MLEKGDLMKRGPQGRGGGGIQMIDRGNEGRGLIEEINWYRMEPDVQKSNCYLPYTFKWGFSC